MKNSITLTEISSGAIKEYNEQVEAIRHQIMKLVCDGYKLPTPDVTCELGANDTIIANISMFWPQEVIEISIDIPKAKIKPRWRRMKPGVWVKWTGWYARNVVTGEVWPVIRTVEYEKCGDVFAATLEGGDVFFGFPQLFSTKLQAQRTIEGWRFMDRLGYEFYKEGEHGHN